MNEDTKSKASLEKDAEMCNDDGAAMATYQSQSNENQNVASTQSWPDNLQTSDGSTVTVVATPDENKISRSSTDEQSNEREATSSRSKEER